MYLLNPAFPLNAPCDCYSPSELRFHTSPLVIHLATKRGTRASPRPRRQAPGWRKLKETAQNPPSIAEGSSSPGRAQGLAKGHGRETGWFKNQRQDVTSIQNRTQNDQMQKNPRVVSLGKFMPWFCGTRSARTLSSCFEE